MTKFNVFILSIQFFFFSSFSHAQSSFLTDPTVRPTVDAYQAICGPQLPMDYQAPEELKNLCRVVSKSELCKEVAKENLINCHSFGEWKKLNIWDFFQGCASGVFNSIEEILSFTWEAMQWVWSHSTSKETRQESLGQAKEYSKMAKLYLHTEYEKAYQTSSDPFKSIKALKKIAQSLGRMLMDSIMDMASKEYHQLGCLNYKAKSETICQLVGSIFLPPAGALMLLKHGPQAVKKIKSVSEELISLKKLKHLSAEEKKIAKLLNKKPKKLKGLQGASGNDYVTKDMKVDYHGEEDGKVFHMKVQYFSDAERENAKVFVNDGKLVTKDGVPLSQEMIGIYVMDEMGGIYVLPESVIGRIHHSTLLAGRPVAAAGHMRIVDGKITYIDNRSGHYQPSPDMLQQVIKELKLRGADTQDADFKLMNTGD
ncbi:MAG: hypothetical protein CME64_06475 [Halobacteriovoraceae bacterium]|nr:hypothetical protein [Halobacteriovoraceae bacterium]